MDWSDLKILTALPGVSGNESMVKQWLIDYVHAHKNSWAVQPRVLYGTEWDECLILEFGTPRTAIFAHIDTIGFTTRYDNRLVMIGGPDLENGYPIKGQDSQGEIKARLVVDAEAGYLTCDCLRPIDRGTELVFDSPLIEDGDFIQSCYLDNRLGVWVALQVAKTMTDGVIVFSCREEHGGGTVPILVKYLYEQLQVRQTLVCDITWATEGVHPGKGVAISMRDKSLPPRKYLERIIKLAELSGFPYQLEVEGSGGSDGREIQASPYAIEWCFVGAPSIGPHTPTERVHKADIESMIQLYAYLMEKL